MSYATANGSATAGQDYTAASSTLAWNAGDTAAKSINVPILDDLLIETNETFTVTLTSPTGGATLGAPATVTVTITDNDVPTCVAPRQLPSGYLPGTRLTVTIAATLPVGALVYGVQDSPPTGWTVGLISDAGVFDAATGKVKFGPFFDANARSLTYELTPPSNETGVKLFTGTASINGASTTLCGGTSLDRLLNHPADNSPTDFIMTLDEVTGYGADWRRGDTWPIGPNPIDIAYVTRAGFLWKNGERYMVDTAQAAPLTWVPVPRPLVAARVAQAVGTPAVPGSWRLLPPRVASNAPTRFPPSPPSFRVHDTMFAGSC